MDCSIESNKQYDALIVTQEAASFLGVSPVTLKQSRHTGILFGKPAPPFIRLNRSVRYKFSSLRTFIEQFQEYQNTSQINEETR
ncbi:MAG: hypothetical protein ACJAVI_005563 [Candidatus Azotimanducaceae bacterium]|jgi:hypothetical protein